MQLGISMGPLQKSAFLFASVLLLQVPVKAQDSAALPAPKSAVVSDAQVEARRPAPSPADERPELLRREVLNFEAVPRKCRAAYDSSRPGRGCVCSRRPSYNADSILSKKLRFGHRIWPAMCGQRIPFASFAEG